MDLYVSYIQTIFADNVVPKQPLFAGSGIYVCKPLQLIKGWAIAFVLRNVRHVVENLIGESPYKNDLKIP
jgi:hypothetical protein